MLPPPAAAPGTGAGPRGAAGGEEPECVATGYSQLTSGLPGGLPASQHSVSRPGVGYETRKWLGATFVPPLVAQERGISGNWDGSSDRPRTHGEERDILDSDNFDQLCIVLIAYSLQGVAKTNGLCGMILRRGFCLT